MLSDLQSTANLELIKLADREVYLLGTAHVSRSSVEEVERAIRELKPDAVCVELCDARLQSLQNPNRWRETDLFQVIRSGRGYVLMAQLALQALQKKLGSKLQVKPGEEMLAAIRVAGECGVPTYTIDRDIKLTLKRGWAGAGLWSLTKLFFASLFAKSSTEALSENEVENLKSAASIENALIEFEKFLPGIKTALVDERDQYMSGKINAVPGRRVLAVVGAAHKHGMAKLIGTPIDLKKLEELPKPGLASTFWKYGFPALILGLFVYACFAAGAGASKDMLVHWVVITGGLAAFGALIVLAHPLTILTAFVAAPFTTIHPLIAAGWVAGLVEALIRKPRVCDLETITDDITSLRGALSNRAIKILLVMAFCNLGSALGAFVGVGSIVSQLS